jgi:hypothetical protein
MSRSSSVVGSDFDPSDYYGQGSYGPGSSEHGPDSSESEQEQPEQAEQDQPEAEPDCRAPQLTGLASTPAGSSAAAAEPPEAPAEAAAAAGIPPEAAPAGDIRHYAVWLLPGYPQHLGVWTGSHPGLWDHILQLCPDGKYSTKVKLRRYPTLEEAVEGWKRGARENRCSESMLRVHRHPVTDHAARRQSPSSPREVHQHPSTDPAARTKSPSSPLVVNQHPIADPAARRQSPSSWLGAFVIRVWAWMRRQLRA